MRSDDPSQTPVPKYDPVAVQAFVVAPAVLSVVVCAWSLWNLDRLPDPMAVHFGFGGEADGFGPPLSFIIVLSVLSLALSLLGLLGATTKGPLVLRRANSVIMVAAVFMIVGLLFSTVLTQVGEEAAEGTSVPLGITTAFMVVGVVWSEIMGRRLTEYPVPTAESTPPSSAPRGPESSASTVTAGRELWITGALLTALTVIGLFFFLPLGVFLLVLLLGSFQLSCRSVVSVTDTAVIVRAGLIRPSVLKIDLSTVKSARPKTFNAMDVGGLGIRSDNDGGTVIAPRGGEAIIIDITEHRWTIVVEDADSAHSIAGDINSRCDRLH